MKIEVPNYNDSMVNVKLDGKSYILRFRYNFFCNYWVFSVKDKDGNDLVTGIKVVPNTVLNLNYMLAGLPQGIFTAVSCKDKIERYDFVNGNAKFFYLSI